MRLLSTSALALITCASVAHAGGMDRTGFPLSALFEKGNYAELGFGYIMPDQEGTVAGGTISSGDMTADFSTVTAAVKFDINEALSFKLVWHQPYGANIDYGDADPTYPLAGTKAEITSSAITGVGRYKFGNGFSAHAGLRYISLDSELDRAALGTLQFEYDLKKDSSVGYLVGVAYEKPEIALRAAFTYLSKVEMEHEALFNGADIDKNTYDLPERFVLDFQTGIAPATLLTAQIIHSKWTQTNIDLPASTGFPPNRLNLVGYEDDVTQYKIGVARQFNKQFAGSLVFGYESGQGDTNASNLSPSDGLYSVTVGGKYTVNDQISLSGGVTYQSRGSVTTEGIGAEFDDNSLLALGVKIGYRF